MKRILVGVDGSSESRKAADYGARLAGSLGLGLELAHVVPAIAEVSPQSMYAYTGLPLRTERAHLMLHEMSNSVVNPNTAVDTSLLEGHPADKLASEALRPDVAMVVIGHRGRGAVERVLLGSVADRLTQICTKPVLVVR